MATIKACVTCKFNAPFVVSLSQCTLFPRSCSHICIASPGNRKPRRSLSLKMSQSARNPAVQHQNVIIPNQHGEKLVGVLYESGTTEIVILCHGFRCSKETNLILNLASALEYAGISSFRFDFSGNGESEGSFQYGNYWKEGDDLYAIAQHFHDAKCVVSAIVGHSKGGDVVLLYASKYHEIKTVINLSGRYNMKAGIEECLGKYFMERIKKDGFIDVKKRSGSFDYHVTEESLMDRLNTNMREACLRIDKDCRVFTVHGSADTIIPVQDAFEFAKIIRSYLITSYISSMELIILTLTTKMN